MQVVEAVQEVVLHVPAEGGEERAEVQPGVGEPLHAEAQLAQHRAVRGVQAAQVPRAARLAECGAVAASIRALSAKRFGHGLMPCTVEAFVDLLRCPYVAHQLKLRTTRTMCIMLNPPPATSTLEIYFQSVRAIQGSENAALDASSLNLQQ